MADSESESEAESASPVVDDAAEILEAKLGVGVGVGDTLGVGVGVGDKLGVATETGEAASFSVDFRHNAISMPVSLIGPCVSLIGCVCFSENKSTHR